MYTINTVREKSWSIWSKLGRDKDWMNIVSPYDIIISVFDSISALCLIVIFNTIICWFGDMDCRWSVVGFQVVSALTNVQYNLLSPLLPYTLSQYDLWYSSIVRLQICHSPVSRDMPLRWCHPPHMSCISVCLIPLVISHSPCSPLSVPPPLIGLFLFSARLLFPVRARHSATRGNCGMILEMDVDTHNQI